MSSLNDLTEQLLSLRALTRITGALHEAQILQLKLWPFVLYPKIKYELRINQDTKTIEYLMQIKGKVEHKFEEFEEGVQWLLGPEWLLKVSVNGKSAFKGTRRIKEIEAAEKRTYTPFIKCVNEYVGKNPEVPEPPNEWKK
jgi:hypothetical protein